jgi:hypothetical protein
MTIKRRKFIEGIRLKGSTNATAAEGELRLDPSALKFKAYVDGAERSIVTEDQAQTLENKTIDADNNTISNIETDNLKAGVLITDISTATSDTELPSALAVKTALEGQNEASEITFDDTNPNVTGTNVQDAVDDVANSAAANATGISDHLADVTDAHTASAITNVPSGNLVATDVQGALDELQTEMDGRPTVSETLQNKTLDSTNTISGSIETPTRSDVKQDTEANLITYASTADDGQIVFATDTQKMYQIIDNALEPIGGGGSTSFEISQASHGFAVGDGIYHNGTTWVKAQANDAATLAYYVVIEVVDANTFVAADFGRIEATAHGYTIGQYYFLSEATPGLATTTEPGSGFSNPLFYVEDANTLQVKVYRPNAVGDNILLDELSDISVPAPTDGQALIYDNGNSRWEAKDIAPVTTATAVTYDNSSSGLTATDVQEAIDEVEERLDTVESNPNNNITALDIDWSLEGVYYKSISAATTFTFSNDSDGQTILIIIENTDVSAQAITWPAGVKTDPNYDGNVEPSTESIFTLVKSNGSIYIAEVKELS